MKLSKIKRMLSKNYKSYFNRIRYFSYIRKMKLRDNVILIEPQQGRTINGNMFYLIIELSKNHLYNKFEIFVALKKTAIESAKEILDYNKIENIKIIPFCSNKYYKLLASSKYLMTDTSFLPFFVKRKGQIVFNTWHGTPLKYLGKKSKNDYFSIGNVQKNFIASDFLLYPNEYTRDHLIEDYMLENISNANIILTGYPRNTAFFDDASKNKIRKELNIENKEVFAYMPTWREAKNSKESISNNTYLLFNLLEIDKKLKENQILYVNLHPLNKKEIDFKMFNNIKEFPSKYETYQFLNAADCLITDYSSVFFDYAITKRKIILFAYDEEQYLKNRGLYFDYKELPFAKAKNIDELINEINSKSFKPYDDFLDKFCKYDNLDVCKKICEKIILKKENDLKIEKIKNNGKKNILLYVGNLAKNGITSSLKNVLSNIDTNANNYYITFSTNKIKNNKEQLLDLPKNVNYIATTGKTNMTLKQKIKFILFRANILPLVFMKKDIQNIYKYEIKRLYADAVFDTAIQFGGYEYKKILLYSAFDCNTVIYVHSDMINEIKTRKNQHRKTLKYAYQKYDKVAVVNEDLVESTFKISKKKDNIYIANNIINYKNVLKKAEKFPVEFDDYTEANISLEELTKILDSDSKKFITIGRFSIEKGHERLIKAFNKIYMENNDTYLIIIGGNGKKYEQTIELVNSLECKENVIIVKTISNPYNILKKCDFFVLSSYYEGFGLVIAEADILNKPVISTNIIGPRNFMKMNNGTLVDNNEQGLYDGMKKLLNNEVKTMNVDYSKYNQEAINQFYKLLKNGEKNEYFN